ncbi:VaFE repeat-containing surface-anchored protein [Corynebacterium simulans]|uniref:VaFE repeat-containing surface-anchored protein n=1 Tax=Corynebacterium simulans TaxID=146827 RepID=UPI002005FA95|nr:VaFE repeat-containing surface-anchored protein [Corynebacterium simulans]MCK6161534.1 VaFE repeat-containing surface-anchored protein [Corynebacterium simulans]
MKTNFRRVLATVVASATVAAAAPMVANAAEGDIYRAFDGSNFVRYGNPPMKGDPGIGDLFVVPKETAESATTMPSVADAELVYCFNENWQFPNEWTAVDSSWKTKPISKVDYKKIPNAGSDIFYKLANQDASDVEFQSVDSNGNISPSIKRGLRSNTPRVPASELKGKVLDVIYNGFDQAKADRAGIQKALGLNDVEFHDATQRAIWYFTENSNKAISNAEENLPSQGAVTAFKLLIGAIDPSKVPGVELKSASENSEATLNLFENSNMIGSNGQPYQHLLSGKFVKPDGDTPIEEGPAPEPEPQPTPTATETETETETDTPVTVTETVTPTTTVTETKPTTSVVTETSGVTTTTVQTNTETATSTVTTTVPGVTVTESTKEPDTTTTLTEPGKEVTETTKAKDVTTTETAPGETVTEKTTEPAVTTTLTEGGSTVVTTVTQPDVTETVSKEPGTTTETVTASDVTTTVTEPGKEVTETTKADDVTTTETQPAATVTETAPQKTVTETTTPAEATVTTTVPVVTEVENAPYIGTKATDKADQDKSFTPEGGVLVDTIEYLGLKPGTEYTVSGELMEKDKDGNAIPTGIKAGATFTPETADGSIDVEFTIPEGFEGKTLVVFEELELAGKVVAEHKNIDSVNQTVVVGEKTPLIGTIAHEKGSDKTDKIVESGKVIDEVEYTNFIPGEEYTIKGELMDYATHKGTGIVAEKTFVAEEANGTVELEFTIPADFGTKVLVAFETAYDANGEKVAEHVDITDNAQTIATGDEPIDGPKPSNPGDNGSSHSGWLWGLIPAAGILGFIGGSSHGSSNGSSHDGVVESPKHEAPKGESAQEAPKSEQPQEAPAKGKRANLANTGADVWMIGLAALLLVVAGGALVLRNRRES